MSISPETRRRIEHFRAIEEAYEPNDTTKRALGDRTILLIVGPAVIGKTSLIKRIGTLDKSYGMSATLSTRLARDTDDPGAFRLFDHNDENLNMLMDKILQGSLVQYKFHPTEGTFYGSELEDHPHEHNMLAMLSGGINQVKNVGFGEARVIGVTVPPSDWMKRFNIRYPEHHPGRLGRVLEADLSYRDLLARTDVEWVINREGELGKAAQDVTKHETDQFDQEEAIAYAVRILQLIHEIRDRAETRKF